ncbi:conserved hypothetical protein (plasmid) [Gloeothece citriformis PCC 7424]|uniref:DUF4145 domain-containing protein n=1 Tax=Gloeothece citriformis (strain PCC 7424) TaxID=65393 RepID=B7KMC5_GLOC7|nr:DUF4145 domain-containing protein [Gloeothece citriformis]ACK73947.1 conserved hypothetical protein [Gloeothece citriformis PCC 7424]
MLSQNLRNKYISRFEELITRGEQIKEDVEIIPKKYYRKPFSSSFEPSIEIPETTKINDQNFFLWKHNCRSLLEQIIPPNSVHRKILDDTNTYWSSESELNDLMSILKALKEDFEKGYLDDLEIKIEAEMAADYMGQAEKLMTEGQTGQYDHVPAAVLAGAVLEKELRMLCSKQTPPISTVNSKGDKLTLNPLIDELKKAGLFNELKAKQLRAWADIRNKAAHGEFDQFNRSDVEVMIKGINEFLANYLT